MTNFKEMSLVEIEAANQYNYIGELARRLNLLTEITRDILVDSKHGEIYAKHGAYQDHQGFPLPDDKPQVLYNTLNNISSGEK